MGNIINKKKKKLESENKLLTEKYQKYKTLFEECEKLCNKKQEYLNTIIEDQAKMIVILNDNVENKNNIIKNLENQITSKNKPLSIQEQRKEYKRQKINRRRR